ncbi:MAG: hypothetical protein P8172_11505 [Gammaproteobacteria bacterium]
MIVDRNPLAIDFTSLLAMQVLETSKKGGTVWTATEKSASVE